MKKTFVQPMAQTIAMEAESNILAGSQPLPSGGSNSGGGPTSADVRYNPMGESGNGDVFLMN
ncbi:MAG: hypothetical protein IJQ05_09595 [Bacteroidaceae bacterium]|jgi:hypothetical protein|nr:hypothetical protein [Bacteroidaceae bacterium]